jgi:hypothetical protein
MQWRRLWAGSLAISAFVFDAKAADGQILVNLDATAVSSANPGTVHRVECMALQLGVRCQWRELCDGL